MITPLRIIGTLVFYAALFVIIRMSRKSIDRDERKTFFLLAGSFAVIAFTANYVLYLLGFMSFLPWINNFIHTFIWIGICLTWLYMGVRDSESFLAQYVMFATFSLIVKYAELHLLGTWDYNHFFHIFEGRFAYILGWSLVDGLIPIGAFFGLRLVSRFVSGLVVL